MALSLPTSPKTIIFVTLLCLGASPLFAFRSVKVRTVTASVVVGGPSPSPEPAPLQLMHTPLLRISPLTRIGVFQGLAGSMPLSKNPIPFEARLKAPASLPPENLVIRVRLRYRFVPPAGSPPAPSESAPILGPDPTPFAFQLTVNGTLEYQILVERLRYQSGQHTPIASLVYPAPLPGQPERWVRVNEPSQASQRVEPSGGRMVLYAGNPNVGDAAIDIPEGVVPPGGATISIDEVALSNPFIPARGGLGDGVVSVFLFESDPRIQGPVQLVVPYADWEFPRGQKGTINGTSADEKTAGLFWNDGHEWRRIGATINPNTNTFSARGNYFGYLAVVVPVPAPSAQDQRPAEKVVTPNGDGINDLVYFNLADFGNNNKVEIFDINNHRIKTLVGGNVTWDGLDEEGKSVESGVYIYQYKAGGETVSGLIAVAK